MASANNYGNHQPGILQAHQPQSFPQTKGGAELPVGWTEHRAPTGHTYYYNIETKTSTYIRPIPPPVQQETPGIPQADNPFAFQPHQPRNFVPQLVQPRRPKPIVRPDRSKTKRPILNAEPWFLVTTKKGLKFFHNETTKESLWEAPDVIKTALEGLHQLTIQEEREQERIRRRGKALKEAQAEQHQIISKDEPDTIISHGQTQGTKRVAGEDIENDPNEHEYYDEEGYDDIEDDHDEKRQRTNEAVEFNEDDIAWQLQGMANEYGLEEEDMEAEDMSLEDGAMIFKEMLNDYDINPYSTWEKEMPKLVDDSRYVVLTTTKARKTVFGDWTVAKIASLKAEKDERIKIDPRIPYLRFLEINASPKLFWQEFRRKFKKEPEMKDPKVSDKEREKYYRDYLSRQKLSSEIKENDLKKLLKSNITLTRSTTVETLPPAISCDVRYVALPQDTRENMLYTYIRTLPEDINLELLNVEQQRQEEERKAQALADRQQVVRGEQYRAKRDAERGREVLRSSEAEIQRAMNVGKEGLMKHLTLDDNQPQKSVTDSNV